MKNFKLDNYLKTIKLYFVFLIVGIMILSLGGFKISSAEALAEEKTIKPVEIENSSTILNNEEVYNIESLTKEMFGDVQIESSEYLYNLDGASDYIYVTFENGGYAVYFKDTILL